MPKIFIEVDTDNAASLDDARAVIDTLGGVPKGTNVEKKKESAPKADKAAPADKKAPAKKEPSESEKAKLYEPVKTIALKLNKEKGRDVLLNTLKAFDVEKAPDISVDQYDAFIEAAQAELDT